MNGGLLDAIERRTGLTPAGVSVLAAAAVALVAGRVAANRPLTLLGYGAVLATAAAWVAGRRGVPATASRSQLPLRVSKGTRVDAGIEVTATRRLSTMVFEEQLAPELGAPVRIPVPSLPAGTAVHHEYSFAPTRRGVYRVGPLVAEWSDPFGLTRRRLVLLEPAEVIVHPSTEAVHDRVVSREWEDPPVRPPTSKPWPTGFEFYGMRDYVSGDDPRRIVWRAAARTGRYLVREAEQGITDRVTVYLDTDASFHDRATPSTSFETAVHVAASLGVKHLDDGFAVSVEANSVALARELRGRRSRIPLLDTLAAVDPEPVPLERSLGRLLIEPRRAGHNVVVTPHLTQNDAARLRIFLQRGTSVLLVLVLGDDPDPAVLHRAGALGCSVVELTPGAPLDRVFARIVGGVRR